MDTMHISDRFLSQENFSGLSQFTRSLRHWDVLIPEILAKKRIISKIRANLERSMIVLLSSLTIGCSSFPEGVPIDKIGFTLVINFR